MSHSKEETAKLRLGMMLAVASAIIFGLYPPAIRATYADGANASFVVVLSTLLRGLFLGGFCVGTRRKLFASKKDRRLAITGGFFQSLSVLGIIGALTYLPGPLVLIVLFTHTLMLLFFLAWRGEAKLDSITLVTTAMALMGLSFVLDLWHAQPATSWLGIGLAFMASLATVSRLYVFGHQTKVKHPAVVGAETFLSAAFFTLVALFFSAPQIPHSAVGWGWFACAVLSLTVGTFGMFYGISLIGSFRWSLFSKIEPIFTALFSFLLLGEALKGSQYFGMALVLGSLIAFQVGEKKKAKVAA